MMKKRPVSRALIICTIIINIIAAGALLLLPYDRGNDAMIMAAVVDAVSALLGAYLLISDCRIELSTQENVFSGMLSVVFLLQLSVTKIISGWNDLNTDQNPGKSVLLAVILAALVLGMYLVVGFGFYCCSAAKRDLPHDKKMNGVYLSIIGAESLLFLVSTYPGIWLQSDAAGVYHAATSCIWDDWHTLGYVGFVRLCTLLWETPFSVNVIQTIIWVLLNWYILDVLAEIDQKAPKIYTALICLCATPFVYLEVVGKDTVYMMGILAVTAVLFSIAYNQAIKLKDTLMICTVPVFAVLCRHAGVVTVLFSFGAMAVFCLIEKKIKLAVKLAGACCYYVLVFVLVNVVFAQAVNAIKNPDYVAYGTPMAMISGAVDSGVEFDEKDTETLEKVMPLERWGECYNKYWVDDIARAWGAIGDDIYTVERLVEEEGYGWELIKINAKLFIRHPFVYVKCLAMMSNMVWEIAMPSDAGLMYIAEVPPDRNIRYSLAYQITSAITQDLDQNPVFRCLISRGGMALFVLMFCFCFCIINRKYSCIFGILPAAVNSAMLILSIPAHDPRYIIPAIVSAIFYLSVVLSMGNMKQNCGSPE